MKLSVDHRIASKYASFVLVEKRSGDRRTHGLPEARPVPVNAPAGWATATVEVTIGGFTGAVRKVRVPIGIMRSTGALTPMKPYAEPVPTDPIAALFARQLASGLWEGDDDTDAGRLLATARALEDCADNRIDTAHPIYGAPVKKAVEAVCALAIRLSADPQADTAGIAAALVAALKVAAGKRLQAEVRAALSRANVGVRLRGEPGPS